MVFGSIVASRPSTSEKPATTDGPPVSVTSTRKRKVVNGRCDGSVSSANLSAAMLRLLGREDVAARLHQAHGEEDERIRRRDAQLHEQPALVDALRRVEAAVGDDAIRLVRRRA